MKGFILVIAMALFFVACESNPASSEDNDSNGKISISALIKQKVVLGKAAAVDSVIIKSARFLIRNIKFRTVVEDSMEFKSAPTVIDLNLNSEINTVSVSGVPFDTYNRIDFRVHRMDPDDPQDAPYVGEAQFGDFMAQHRYSIIIEGIVHEGTAAPRVFTFRSRISEKQRHFLNPVVTVSQSNPDVNLTMVVEPANWFKDSNGNFLDPSDENNENDISDNLKDSIRIIKDNNRDGKEDNS